MGLLSIFGRCCSTAAEDDSSRDHLDSVDRYCMTNPTDDPMGLSFYQQHRQEELERQRAESAARVERSSAATRHRLASMTKVLEELGALDSDEGGANVSPRRL